MTTIGGSAVKDLDFDDDELTGKILTAMREPVSDPEAAIQELRAHSIANSVRVKRIEESNREVVAAAKKLGVRILLASFAVASTVIGAAYQIGADRARDREQLDQVIHRLDRIDGHAEAAVERSERR
jgi:hypothetical protein